MSHVQERQLSLSSLFRTPIHNAFRHFYTPPHNSGGVLWFHVGCQCVRPSVRFSFQDDN